MSSVEHSTTSGYTIGADHDYGLSVMASAVLNGAVAFGSRSPVAIEEEDLDPLVTLIQDAVTNMNTDTMSTDTDTPDIPDTDTTKTTDMTMTGTTSVTTTNYEFKHLFDSAATQNRTIHQALRRIQSHRVELQDRLTLVQNLSPDHDTAAVQEILLRAERAVVAISPELDKYRRKEVKSEVEDTKAVARCLTGLLKSWRTLHPDSSPIQIDNSSHACNPTSAKNTPTLIAYSVALVGQIMERMSRRGCSLLLKSIRLFGYSLTILQEGGPNRQQQAALTDIPEDIRVLEKKFKLDIKTTVFAKRESSDGRFYYEVKGPDGKLFIQERGREGRWFFKLHADFFNIEGNKVNGKHSSTGVISMTCLNLPLDIREDSAFVYVAGIIQGPHEPNSKEAEHNHYIRPLIDELLIAYTQGIRCASAGGQETPYGRIHRVLLAFISLDFKAARPFAGLLDVGSHCYCFTCKTWHRAYLNSTNYEDWEAVDDDFLREGAEKWRDAQTKAERIAIEEQYGVRYSQFWRLPYWQPSKQVTTDPMHTGYQLLEKNFFRDGLRLNNPESKEDPKNKSTAPSSTYAHHYAFIPPPLQFIGSNHVIQQTDVDDEDEVDENTLITGLQWDHLSEDLRCLRNRRMMVLGNDFRSSPRLLGQLSDIHTLLSDSRPSTMSDLVQLRTRLGRMNWTTLLFVCEDLLAFKSPSILRMEIIQKSQITKDDMINALVDWVSPFRVTTQASLTCSQNQKRSNVVQEDGPFVWPHFTSTHHGPPRSAQTPTITYFNGLPCRTLTDSEREALMKQLVSTMAYKTAVHIGHIHQYLWQPIGNNELGKVKLANILKTKNRVALLFVCLDLNRVPMNMSHKTIPKKDLISQLVEWVSTIIK
ncbi:hypothetical protein LENED_006599 [Lentinula edodes]|uniref:Uncharacterized protein n=1 Tax=Lentinula edodes TaxID=5353 RepID=A0A1Q3EC70_LENED|nr:hypothetical protein LENED_006599 [Lentinula edodes]